MLVDGGSDYSRFRQDLRPFGPLDADRLVFARNPVARRHRSEPRRFPRRQETVDSAYISGDPDTVLEVMREFGADYLVVGRIELARYPGLLPDFSSSSTSPSSGRELHRLPPAASTWCRPRDPTDREWRATSPSRSRSQCSCGSCSACVFTGFRLAAMLSAPVGGVELDSLSGAWQAHAGNADERFIPTLFQAFTSWSFIFTSSETPARVLALLASCSVPLRALPAAANVRRSRRDGGAPAAGHRPGLGPARRHGVARRFRPRHGGTGWSSSFAKGVCPTGRLGLLASQSLRGRVGVANRAGGRGRPIDAPGVPALETALSGPPGALSPPDSWRRPALVTGSRTPRCRQSPLSRGGSRRPGPRMPRTRLRCSTRSRCSCSGSSRPLTTCTNVGGMSTGPRSHLRSSRPRRWPSSG